MQIEIQKYKNITRKTKLFLCFSDQQGVVALLTVIIISAAVLIMALNASLLGLGELDLGYTSQKAGEVFSIADGCMEEALRRLRLDAAYSGDALNLGSGSCIIEVDTIGSISTIIVTANIDNTYYKKIQTTANVIDSVISINNWKEISQ